MKALDVTKTNNVTALPAALITILLIIIQIWNGIVLLAVTVIDWLHRFP